MTKSTVRILADDLTGALDTAAELVGIASPMPVFWHGATPSVLPPSAAIESGTRELAPHTAADVAARFAPHLSGADIAYKKIDSLLRGPTLAELAACMGTGLWQHAVLCPAFPYQGRATRGGEQFARDAAGNWSAVTGDLVTALQTEGTVAYRAEIGQPLQPGIGVFDAESDEDLRRVVETGQLADRVLWIGAGGLAQGLAGGTPQERDVPSLPTPILGLFGSDHAVTASQLETCDPHWIKLRDTDPAPLIQRLSENALALASFDLPPELSRTEAAERIRSGFAHLLGHLPPPGTLLAAGGETLFGICGALGATHLEVQGRIVPGLPRSILRGGRWDGVTVVSKSGAFGAPALLRDLVVERTLR